MNAVAAKPLAGGFTRRGACPALSAPMQTGDGLLVRLNPVSGGLTPEALVGLCEAAIRHGNGIVEITARGSIQIRGLTESSAALFAEAVDTLAIPVHTGVPVQAGILAGLDPHEIADATALVASIRAAIMDAGFEGRLGPKVSVVVDAGGRTALEEIAADLRLTATDGGWCVAIAGDAATAKPVGVAFSDEASCAAAVAVLEQVAELGRAGRARDLDIAKIANAIEGLGGLQLVSPPSVLPDISPCRGEITPPQALASIARLSTSGQFESTKGATKKCVISPLEGEMSGRTEGGVQAQTSHGSLLGVVYLRGNKLALGIALPFGNTDAGTLRTFAEAAAKAAIRDIRPAPRRTLVAICDTELQAVELQRVAASLGFITTPNDPRQSISACPGAPDCASGHIPARRLAADFAASHAEFLDGSLHLHISGCAKGCAHPAASDLAFVGTPRGLGLVLDGTAREEPAAFAENDDAGRAFANVATVVAAERMPDETSMQTLTRIGLSKLSEVLKRSQR